VSGIYKIIGLFCKRALWKRQYSAKEIYNLIDPTNRSHPIVITVIPSLHLMYSFGFIFPPFCPPFTNDFFSGGVRDSHIPRYPRQRASMSFFLCLPNPTHLIFTLARSLARSLFFSLCLPTPHSRFLFVSLSLIGQCSPSLLFKQQCRLPCVRGCRNVVGRRGGRG